MHFKIAMICLILACLINIQMTRIRVPGVTMNKPDLRTSSPNSSVAYNAPIENNKASQFLYVNNFNDANHVMLGTSNRSLEVHPSLFSDKRSPA